MIVLDTHAWIWWVAESKQLSAAARKAITNADTIGIHPISCWEIAMLVEKNRLVLNCDVEQWVATALRMRGVTVVDLTSTAAVLAARLPGVFHGDPADRLIVASCLNLKVPLVTKDTHIRRWRRIETIW